MRIPLAAVLLSLAFLTTGPAAGADAPALSESHRYTGGSSAPLVAPDGSLSRAHLCATGNTVPGAAWIGCAFFGTSTLPPGAYDVTISVVDDLNPLLAFDWQVWPDGCSEWSCAADACGVPGQVQEGAGSVTFHLEGACGMLTVWPGNGATRGTISVVAVEVPAQA
jgi:hypothetical protein